ncbi:XdhC family protein [Streptomyces malaysiensis]|uniref:XdhC family protein n=1 Tax=Streptomyces malaysiensis TaxID=92644 RepID=UPI003FA7812A
MPLGARRNRRKEGWWGSGAPPCPLGTSAAVDASGRMIGSISGGCVDPAAVHRRSTAAPGRTDAVPCRAPVGWSSPYSPLRAAPPHRAGAPAPAADRRRADRRSAAGAVPVGQADSHRAVLTVHADDSNAGRLPGRGCSAPTPAEPTLGITPVNPAAPSVGPGPRPRRRGAAEPHTLGPG